MIAELIIATGLVYSYKRFTDKTRIISKKFKQLMKNEKLNYTIVSAVETDYGFKLIINLLEYGYADLEKLKDILQTTYGLATAIEQNKDLKTATISLINTPLVENYAFSPIKIEPYQLYCGKGYKNQNLIADMSKFPHALVTGQSGCGKTEEIKVITTNLINNFTDRDINIYFSDLSDVSDYRMFTQNSQIKGYARNIDEGKALFEYLQHIYVKRLGIFYNRNCTNIKDYNKYNYEKRMSYIYVVLDEFADYFPENKLVDDYEKKIQCYNIIKKLIRETRKAGMFFIIGIQRPDTTVLDPSLRSGLCTKIAFSQNSDASSLTVCDTTELTNIENRKALFMMGNQREWFKTATVTNKILRKYTASSIDYKRTDFNKFLGSADNKAIIPLVNSNKPKSKCKVKIKCT